MPNKSSPHGGTVLEGSISTGTLRQPDLLRSFADELNRLLPFNGAALAREAMECADAIDAGADEFNQVPIDLSASEIIDDLTEQLNDIAQRDGMQFGAHHGDGADFGFWATEDGED